MAEQAGIRTLLLTKSQSHFRIRDVINLMSSGFEHERIHDGWHVARNAPATLGVSPMVRVRRRRGLTLKTSVASYAHKIGLIPEFHRRRIRSPTVVLLVVGVRIVASTAAHL